jgi:hypothetical protein
VQVSIRNLPIQIQSKKPVSKKKKEIKVSFLKKNPKKKFEAFSSNLLTQSPKEAE